MRKTYPINYNPKILLDYSCSCLLNDTSFNTTKINDTNIINTLINRTSLYKTLGDLCEKSGGFANGTGCATPVYHPNIFFFSVLLFLLTFFICMGLQEFRRSAFFPAKVNAKKKKNYFK